MTTSTSPDTSSMTASTSGEYEIPEVVADGGGRRTEECTSGVDNISSELAQAYHIDTEGALSRLLREASLIVQWRRKRQVYDSYIDVRAISGGGRVVELSLHRVLLEYSKMRT